MLPSASRLLRSLTLLLLLAGWIGIGLRAGAAPAHKPAPRRPVSKPGGGVVGQLVRLGPVSTGSVELQFSAEPADVGAGDAAPRAVLPSLPAGPGGASGRGISRLKTGGREAAQGGLTVRSSRPLAPGGSFPGALSVASPAVAGAGLALFTVGNDYAALSTDGGATFRYLDPRVSPQPPAGLRYAGRQDVAYLPELNAFAWTVAYSQQPGDLPTLLRLYLGTATELAAGRVRAVELDGRSLGVAGAELDGIRLAAGGGSLFMSASIARAGRVVGAALVRLSLSDLRSGDFHRSGVFATDRLTHLTVVQGGGRSCYAAALTSRSSVQVLKLDEGSSAVWGASVAVTPFSGDPVRSVLPDGSNWLARVQPQLETATLSGDELWLAWTVGAAPEAGYSHAHVRIARVSGSQLALIGEHGLGFPQSAAAYPALAATAEGQVGIVFAVGGGEQLPSPAAGLLTGAVEFQPLAEGVASPGESGYGDRTAIQALGHDFLAASYRMGPDGGVEPLVAVFGRERGLASQAVGAAISGRVTRDGAGESGVTITAVPGLSFLSSTELSIPDDGPAVESSLTVPNLGPLVSVEVGINLDHTFVADLTVDLVHPDGTEVRLHDHGGGSSDDLVGTYPSTLEPAQSLAVLAGKASAGVWKLRIQDSVGADTGRLRSWSLRVALGALRTVVTNTSGDFRFQGLEDGNYVLTAVKPGRKFTPSERVVALQGTDVTGQDFTVKSQRISGRITRKEIGESGVTVNLAGSELEGASAAVNPNLAIPSPQGSEVESALDLVGAGTIGDVRVSVSLEHSYRGDLELTLIHPDGTEVRLKDSSAADDGHDLVGTFPTTLDTAESLGFLFGRPYAGTWRLRVRDAYPALDHGVIRSWSLTVTETREVRRTVVTDANGDYSFDGVLDGFYEVAPAKGTFTFSPPSGFVSVNGEDVADVNFTVDPYRVSGRVTRGGAGESGVTVALNPGNRTTVTRADGFYLFDDVEDGTYTVSPAKDSLTILPVSQTAIVNGASVTGLDFTISTYTMSGRVTRNGTGESGVVLTLTPGNRIATTAGDGTYVIENVGDGSYVLTASKPGRTFAPAERPVTVQGAPVNGQDFAIPTYRVAGRVTRGGAAESGVTVTLGGSEPADVTAAISPNQAIPGPRGTQVEARLNVSGDGTIAGVRVGVDLAHSFRGDLELTLVHPDGTEVRLQNVGSDDEDDLVGTYPTTLEPVESLNALAGKTYAGTWRLRVRDLFLSADDGVFRSWSITVLTSGRTLSRTATTDAQGDFAFDDVLNGTYTLIPGKPGLAFTPDLRTVPVAGADVSGQDFTALVPTSVRATFSLGSGSGAAGSTVSLPLKFTPNQVNVVAASFDVTFDPAHLTFVNAAAGTLPTGFAVRSEGIGPGRVRVRLTRKSGTGVLRAGSVANLGFRIAEGTAVNSMRPVRIVTPGSATEGVQVTDSAGALGYGIAKSGNIVVIRVPGKLAVSTKTLDFGQIPWGTTAIQSFRVRNAGWEPLEVTIPASVSPRTTPFAVTAGSGTVTLAPQEEHEVTVTFTPPVERRYSGNLKVTSVNPRGTSTITLKGVGN